MHPGFSSNFWWPAHGFPYSPQSLYTHVLVTGLYTVNSTLHNVHFLLYTVLCTLYTIQCTLYTVHCEQTNHTSSHVTHNAFTGKPILRYTHFERPRFKPIPLQHKPSALTTLPTEAGIKVWNRSIMEITETVHSVQSRESEMNRAAVALSWSSLLATLHSLLTSHDRQDEQSWTKTVLNKND